MSFRKDNDGWERILHGEEKFLEEVRTWLQEEDSRDAILRAAVHGSLNDRIEPLADLDRRMILHLDELRDLCVRYRLRFLPSGYFKGHVPSRTLGAIRTLETRAGRPLKAFMVMAVPRLFRIPAHRAEPTLFVRVSEEHYLLVHRWGHGLGRARAILLWPLRSPWSLVTTLLVMALAISAIAPPDAVFSTADHEWWSPVRLVFLFWISALLGGITTFVWFAFRWRFSSEAWRSNSFS